VISLVLLVALVALSTAFTLKVFLFAFLLAAILNLTVFAPARVPSLRQSLSLNLSAFFTALPGFRQSLAFRAPGVPVADTTTEAALAFPPRFSLSTFGLTLLILSDVAGGGLKN